MKQVMLTTVATTTALAATRINDYSIQDINHYGSDPNPNTRLDIQQEPKSIAEGALKKINMIENPLRGLTEENDSGENLPDYDQKIVSDTNQALADGVFGAPSYVMNGEVFWGQDRLDLLAWRLQQEANND